LHKTKNFSLLHLSRQRG